MSEVRNIQNFDWRKTIC